MSVYRGTRWDESHIVRARLFIGSDEPIDWIVSESYMCHVARTTTHLYGFTCDGEFLWVKPLGSRLLGPTAHKYEFAREEDEEARIILGFEEANRQRSKDEEEENL